MLPGWLGIALAAVGGVALLAWLLAAARLWSERPPPDVRQELSPMLPRLGRALRRLGEDPALDTATRSRARRAAMYVAWPIDLMPWPIDVDDIVVALGALRRVHVAYGTGPIARAFEGDELALNAALGGIGLPPEWDDGAKADGAKAEDAPADGPLQRSSPEPPP